MRAIALIPTLLLMITGTIAASIQWTGVANDDWHNRLNWSPIVVPGPADDVHIASGTVNVNSPAAASTVYLGFESTTVLTLANSFSVGNGGLSVGASGTVVVNAPVSPAATISAVNAAIVGTLNITTGTLAGSWTVLGNANLDGVGVKAFSQCNFSTVSGRTALGGTLVLNQNSLINITGSAALTAANTNLTIQNGDGSAVAFDASGASSVVFSGATSVFTIQAPVLFSTLTLLSGNLVVLADLTFTQPFNIPATSTVTASGNIVFNASMGFTGNGSAVLSCATVNLGPFVMNGALTLNAGVTNFIGAASVKALTINGATAVVSAAVSAVTLSVTAGSTVGAGTITAANAVFAPAGAPFTINSPIVATSSATFNAGSIAFLASGSLTLSSTAVATIAGATTLSSTSAGLIGVANNGLLHVAAALTSQYVGVGGAGTMNITSSASFESTSITQATIVLCSGASITGTRAAMTATAVSTLPTGVVKAVIGNDAMSCPGSCEGIAIPSTNFTFTASP